MIDTRTINDLAFLGEGDIGDWVEIIFIVAVFIISFIGKKLSDKKTQERAEQTQRDIADRKSQPTQQSPQAWKKVETSAEERRQFLAAAQKRKLERKNRIRMLKRELEHGVADFEHAEYQPLPSEVESAESSEPVFVQASEPEFIHQPESFVKTAPAPQPTPPAFTQPHDSVNCDTTHRLLKDTKYDRRQEQQHAVQVDLSSVEKLRQAVVMSEILGQPKALRADTGYWDF